MHLTSHPTKKTHYWTWSVPTHIPKSAKKYAASWLTLLYGARHGQTQMVTSTWIESCALFSVYIVYQGYYESYCLCIGVSKSSETKANET